MVGPTKVIPAVLRALLRASDSGVLQARAEGHTTKLVCRLARPLGAQQCQTALDSKQNLQRRCCRALWNRVTHHQEAVAGCMRSCKAYKQVLRKLAQPLATKHLPTSHFAAHVC
jgi:hypothetical protein